VGTKDSIVNNLIQNIKSKINIKNNLVIKNLFL